MKNLNAAFVVLIGGFALVKEVSATPFQVVSGQQFDAVFRTKVACEAAFEMGQFRVYTPKYLGDNKKNPVNGKDRVRVLLPHDMCMELYTVVGWRFVVQKKGTAYRAIRMPDGSLVLYARDDCGNDSRGTVFPPPSVPVAPAVVALAPTPLEPIRPRPVTAPAPEPSPMPTATPEPSSPPSSNQPPEGPSTSQWGLTASGMVGVFDSIPIGGDGGFIEGISGRRTCIKGRTIDLGFARGGIMSSMWRFTVVSKSFNRGSFTEYKCTSCTQEVRMVEDGNVRTLGFQVERVQGFNNTTWGSIRPMVSVNAGAGRISGSVRRFSGPVGKPATKTETVGASELFGSRWVPNAGLGIGVMGDLGKHFTYAVTLVGVEYPGSYYGRVLLTYWPKKK